MGFLKIPYFSQDPDGISVRTGTVVSGNTTKITELIFRCPSSFGFNSEKNVILFYTDTSEPRTMYGYIGYLNGILNGSRIQYKHKVNGASTGSWTGVTYKSSAINRGIYSLRKVEIGSSSSYYSDISGNAMPFVTVEQMYNEADIYFGTEVGKPIAYIPINSALDGPLQAKSGDSVSVDVSFPEGYIYQERGISVYDTNGAVPYSYDPVTGKLTFIMP